MDLSCIMIQMFQGRGDLKERTHEQYASTPCTSMASSNREDIHVHSLPSNREGASLSVLQRRARRVVRKCASHSGVTCHSTIWIFSQLSEVPLLVRTIEHSLVDNLHLQMRQHSTSRIPVCQQTHIQLWMVKSLHVPDVCVWHPVITSQAWIGHCKLEQRSRQGRCYEHSYLLSLLAELWKLFGFPDELRVMK